MDFNCIVEFLDKGIMICISIVFGEGINESLNKRFKSVISVTKFIELGFLILQFILLLGQFSDDKNLLKLASILYNEAINQDYDRDCQSKYQNFHYPHLYLASLWIYFFLSLLQLFHHSFVFNLLAMIGSSVFEIFAQYQSVQIQKDLEPDSEGRFCLSGIHNNLFATFIIVLLGLSFFFAFLGFCCCIKCVSCIGNCEPNLYKSFFYLFGLVSFALQMAFLPLFLASESTFTALYLIIFSTIGWVISIITLAVQSYHLSRQHDQMYQRAQTHPTEEQ